MYWVDKKDFTVDYLAYKYAVNGGGIRFRKAYNERGIEGIRFVDYKNYKPETLDVSLQDLDTLFENDKLELLSIIENTEVTVKLLN